MNKISQQSRPLKYYTSPSSTPNNHLVPFKVSYSAKNVIAARPDAEGALWVKAAYQGSSRVVTASVKGESRVTTLYGI